MSGLATRFAVTLAALLLAAIIGLVALGFLALGVYLSLNALMPAREAAFGTALAAFLFAAIVLLIARGVCAIAVRRARRKGARNSIDESRLAALFGDALGSEFAALAAAHPETTVIGSLLSGFAVGASPGMRRALRDVILGK